MTTFFRATGYNRQQRKLKRIAKIQAFLKLCLRWSYRRGIFYALAIVGIGFGIQQGRNKLPELNPMRWKNLKSVELEGNSMLPFEDVLSIALLDTGMLMDSIDEYAIEARLLEEPWVSSVEISKVFPSKLKMKFQESKPVMSAFEAGRFAVYSETGKMLPLSTKSAYKYPVVSVSTREEREVCAAFLFAMLKLDPVLYAKVSQVSLVENGVEVFFSDVRFKTLFSAQGNWTKKVFDEYWKMVRVYSNELTEAEFLDLRFEGFAYVKNVEKRRKNNG